MAGAATGTLGNIFFSGCCWFPFGTGWKEQWVFWKGVIGFFGFTGKKKKSENKEISPVRGNSFHKGDECQLQSLGIGFRQRSGKIFTSFFQNHLLGRFFYSSVVRVFLFPKWGKFESFDIRWCPDSHSPIWVISAWGMPNQFLHWGIQLSFR